AASLGRLSKLISHYEKFKGEELNQRLKEEGFDPADDIRFRKFGELYNRILDFPRHLGQHSGGMVISLGRLDGIVPLEPASMAGRNIIQWDKDDCARLKIVKVDLLGLGMMAVLRDSITLIGEHHGRDLSLYKIPYDDAKVFEALQNADTVGMFQVESRAQIAFLPKSKPVNFYDIVVQVAIIRPGPIVGNMLKSYIARRQGFEEIDYIDERLKPTLQRTLGVPLFQEQLLKIAMDIADFSGGEAEELRRAMGFKRPDRRMEQIETNLRAGMTRNNVSEKTQDMIVKCVKAFANYGFPESHAYSFALLAYASAYFMVHYRACFMAAMFNNYPLGFYNAATLVKDAQRHGLHFIALDINRSQYEFTVEEVRTACVSGRPVSPASDAECEFRVRVGLNFVRGLRKEVAEAIVAERDGCRSPHISKGVTSKDEGEGEIRPCSRAGFCNERVPYSSVEDLVRRVPMINKREIRTLSLAGALNFDGTVHRREALWQSELAIQPAGELFENAEDRMQNAERKDSSFDIHHSSFLKRMEGLQLVETDLRKTGISIGKHPMAFIRDELTKRGVLSSAQTRHAAKGEIVSAAGAVIIRQRPMTANKVVFITLEDETGHSNFVVMPDVFERFRAVINQNDYLVIKGRSEDGGIIKALYFQPIQTFTAEVVSHNFR
ncbi:MAG: error-prone DNA polymerase, partial [Pyrinomonadaceae bacterium]